MKRGIDEFNIEDGEAEQVDHLMFMVHGIGSACDLKFRSVEQVGEEYIFKLYCLVCLNIRLDIFVSRGVSFNGSPAGPVPLSIIH